MKQPQPKWINPTTGSNREEGTCNSPPAHSPSRLGYQPINWAKPPRPTRPNRQTKAATAPIMKRVCPKRVAAIEKIAELAGERPKRWNKPRFGEFEYWLAHQCGWITDNELADDTAAYKAKQLLAKHTSHQFSLNRFSWVESPKFEDPPETAEYVPQLSMKLVKDRNLTDSARRIAMFVLRHTYQDNRQERFIGMTVSFIMKGLSISRRTVQRSLTLLETRGYFRCQVAKGKQTRMCVGLIIHLMESLFPKHHKEKWPEKRKNSGASTMPPKQIQFYKSIYNAKIRTPRFSWAVYCMDAIASRAFKRGNEGELSVPDELLLVPG